LRQLLGRVDYGIERFPIVFGIFRVLAKLIGPEHFVKRKLQITSVDKMGHGSIGCAATIHSTRTAVMAALPALP